MRRVKRASGGRLRAASLVEAVVAAVVLLIAFTAAMELLPRLTLRGDDALAVAEAEYRAMCAFDKYGSGVWPAGTYVERYGGGEATVRVEPYRQYNDVQLITIEVRIDGSRKRIVQTAGGMRRVKHMLRGSTLAETLVMMLVAGIVFLATMEALTLVSRLVARRAAVLVEAGRQRDGIFRLGQLLTTADSIRSAEGGGTGELLYLYRAGGETTLTTRDSAAVFVAGEFRDTLLRRVGHMQLLRCDAAADTLEIDVGSHMLKLPVLRPAWESYGRRIAEIEKDHGYEEP